MERSRLLRTGAMERMMYCMLHATGSKKELTARTYYVLVSDLLEHDEVQRLKQFRHHVHTTRFQHSLNVSYYSYWLCRRFHWDAVSAARAGLLHDLYFYETSEYDREQAPNQISHLTFHPKLALLNASMRFSLNAIEKDIIVHHMWPISRQRPQYKESFVVSFVDKYVAVLEYFAPLFRRMRASARTVWEIR